MRFNVPQFIEIEDKIFGPLTWKQFLYVGGGFGLAIVLFLVSLPLFFIIGLPVAGLAGLLAFYPINNRPFSLTLEAAFNFLMSEKEYYWGRSKEVVYKYKESDEIPTTHTVTASDKVSGISSLSRKLELEALQKTEE